MVISTESHFLLLYRKPFHDICWLSVFLIIHFYNPPRRYEVTKLKTLVPQSHDDLITGYILARCDESCYFSLPDINISVYTRYDMSSRAIFADQKLLNAIHFSCQQKIVCL